MYFMKKNKGNNQSTEHKEKDLEFVPVEEIEVSAAESKIKTSGIKAKPNKKTIKIRLRTIIIVIIIIALLALAYIFKGLFIAATVDGSPVSRLRVIERLEKVYGQSLLDSFINQKLVNTAALANNIEITTEEIDEEIKKIEEQLTAQGSTLNEALAMQNMTRANLQEEITFQKQLEQLVADKVTVTNEEIADYISAYGLEIPEDQQELADEQIRSELRNQKLNQEINTLLDNLKAEANIKYFIKY